MQTTKEKRPRPRIETLADLIFGLSLSVGSLALIATQFWEWTFYGVPTRMYVWYLPLISYWVGRAVRSESRTYTIAGNETQ